MSIKIKKFQDWLSFNSRVLLSPNSLFQDNNDYKGGDSYTEPQIASYAFLNLLCASISWALGLYLLRPSYSAAFLFYIGFASFVQFYIIKHSLPFFRIYLEDRIRKKYEDQTLSLKGLETLGLLSALPWVFFTALAGLVKGLSLSPLLIIIVYFSLGFWSFAIFILGVQGLCNLTFSQLCRESLRTLRFLALFLLLLLSCFILHFSAYLRL